MPDGGVNLKKSLAGTVKSLGDRQVRVIVSTKTADREGDIVEVEGINLSAYRKNPVILFNHNMNCPVARATEIELRSGRLEATAQFPPEGTDEDSDRCYKLIKAGIINAASIGFIPTEWNFIDDTGWSRRFSKCEMIEFSFVSIPANAEALIIERSLASGTEEDEDETMRTLKDLCASSTSPFAISKALEAAALGAALVEKSRVPSAKEPDPESPVEEKGSPEGEGEVVNNETKECGPKKPKEKDEGGTCPMGPHGDEDDDKPELVDDAHDPTHHPEKTADGDEDDKKSAESIDGAVSKDDQQTDTVEKSEGGEAATDTDEVPAGQSLRLKRLRELELLKYRVVS